jgi:hypothetical protein
MGQDFRAIFGHSLTSDELLALPSTLNRITAAMARDFRAIRVGREIRWSWRETFPSPDSFAPWFERSISEYGCADLRATDALWISATWKILEVGSWVRWREFTLDPTTQSILRSFCAGVARLARARVVYYLPDSGRKTDAAGDVMFEGGSIEDVAQVLARLGPSKASITDACADGYYAEQVPIEPP